MIPQRARRAAWAGVLAGLALACRLDDDGGADGGTDDSTGTTTEGAGEIPSPAFLNPALGEFLVLTTQHVPRDLVVAGITPGNTELVVDGQSAGPLGPGSTLGELTDERLTLYFHGALTPGTHTLQLASTAPDGPRHSSKLTMIVKAPEGAPPRLRVDLAADPLAAGTGLVAAGSGSGGVLGVLTGGPEPTLRLHLAGPGGWLPAPLAEIGLEGHVLDPMSLGTSIALRLDPPEGDVVAALTVAHRRGLPGDAVVARDVALAPEIAVGPPRIALGRDDPLFAGAEHVAIGRPALLGRVVVAEFTAAADSEIPHPGDRGLALVRRRTDGSWAEPVRVATSAPLDLDGLGPVLDLTAPGQVTGLSVRVGQRLAGVLTLTDAGAAQISLALDDITLPSADPCVLTTLASSFGSRTVAVAARDLGLRLAFLGTRGDPVSGVPEFPAGKLPDAPAAGAPAAAVILGFSTFLVPYGDAAPVHVVRGDGAGVDIEPLTVPEPIHCRAVALLPAAAAPHDPDVGDPALPFACLTGGLVRVGILAVDPAAP